MPAKIDPALLPHNALLLDPQLQVLCCGAGAKTLLAANPDFLRIQQGHLVAMRQRITPGQNLALARPGRLPLSLLSQPVADPRGGVTAFLVTLIDPEANRLDRQVLQDLFGLTRTEARIAGALSEGHGTNQIAGELGVQLNTVHAHIKKLLAKTGTARQVQLVALLWRCATTVALPHAGSPGPAKPAPLPAGDARTSAATHASSGNDITPYASETEAC